MSPRIISEAKIQEKPSTGPKTEEGKVSHNAVKSALTGATVLLPTDDAALYEQHIQNIFKTWQPETYREELLVQGIADTLWRLRRIPALIAATYGLGRRNHADKFASDPEHLRTMLLDAYIEEASGRQLRNLRLQENRLRRHLEKDTAELEQLQKERRALREKRLAVAAELYRDCIDENLPFVPSEFGFEFSMDEIEERIGLRIARQRGLSYAEQFAKSYAEDRRKERLAQNKAA